MIQLRKKMLTPNTKALALGLLLAALIASLLVAKPAMAEAGAVWAWGSNDTGQLGNGTHGSGMNSNVPVSASNLGGVKAVEGGCLHSLTLKEDGTVRSWGANSYGQLGNGNNTLSDVPVQVKIPPAYTYLSGVDAIAAGCTHNLALKEDGTVRAWGNNERGALGDGTYTNRNRATQVMQKENQFGVLFPFTGVKAVAGGGDHSLALKDNGTVWAWGWNSVGQLGIGAGGGPDAKRNTPTQVSGLSQVKAIAAGGSHSLALKEDGTVWAWGRNLYGQVGEGTTATYSNTPIQVSGLDGVKAIAAGGDHNLALKEDGTIWAWGRNFSGQLGNGTTTNSSKPIQVSGLDGGIEAVAAGGPHSLVLKDDGTVWSWGANQEGQLGNGDGTYADSTVPVQVSNLLGGVQAIGGGSLHSLAVKQ